MKATFEFDLELPEDRENYKIYSKAMSMHRAFDDVYNQLIRPLRKYDTLNGQAITDEKLLDFAEKIFEKYFEILEENEVNS